MSGKNMPNPTPLPTLPSTAYDEVRARVSELGKRIRFADGEIEMTRRDLDQRLATKANLERRRDEWREIASRLGIIDALDLDTP